MVDINWDVFRYRNEDKNAAFESLAVCLFERKFQLDTGIFRYKNQAGIENEPVYVGGEWIGFQAKYFETKISGSKLIDSLRKAKARNPKLQRVLLYVYPEFSESSKLGEKKPVGQKKVEEEADRLQLHIEWQVPSQIESQLRKLENQDIAERFFSNPDMEQVKGQLEKIIEQQKSLQSVGKLLSVDDIRNRMDTTSGDFNVVCSYFGNLEHTFIKRKEVNELLELIRKPVVKEGENLIILSGKAGIGKSVVMKEVLKRLKQENIPVLALKADMRSLDFLQSRDEKGYAFDSLLQAFDLLSKDASCVAFLVDQIDALSQSFSNDRGKIRAYLNLINGLLTANYKHIKIVVSCRKFDLNYDPLLSKWSRKKVVKLEELSLEEVKRVLSVLLNEEVESRFSGTTLELLRVPQNLDIFCRIYQHTSVLRDYATLQSLYEELWNLYIQHPGLDGIPVCTEELEGFVFRLAKYMQATESLIPYWKDWNRDSKAIAYLASVGLITYDDRHIRFMHQSLFDYVYARSCVNENKSLYGMLIQQHQGLFIRPMVRQVLEYMRAQVPEEYGLQLRQIFFSGKVRFHIQLLVMELMASCPEILPVEKRLVLDMLDQTPELFSVFLGQELSVEWFDALCGKLKCRLFEIEDKDKGENKQLIFFFARYAKQRLHEVLDLISRIKFSHVRLVAAEQVLWFTEDFSDVQVVDLYRKVKVLWKYHAHLGILLKALDSNPEFVCREIETLIWIALPCWKEAKECKEIEEGEFFTDLCQPFVEKYPALIYPVIKRTVVELIKSTEYYFYEEGIKFNQAFHDWTPEKDNYYVLISWIKDILISRTTEDFTFVDREVDKLINSQDTMLLCVAFQVMRANPALFAIRFYYLFRDQQFIDHMLGYGDQEYYFRELLKESYHSWNSEQREEVKKFIGNFVSMSDHIPSPEKPRLWGVLYPHLGVHQWKLLHSLPESALDISLKRKMQELDRRFQDAECKNEEPNHYVTMATIAGGLVSSERYKRFSLQQWYRSFLKCRPDRWGKQGEPFDIERHARSFGECVRDAPEKYRPFVETITADGKIHIRYKIQGLAGLIAGKPEAVTECKGLFFEILNSEVSLRYEYELIRVAGKWMQCGTDTDPDIVNYLCGILLRPYQREYDLREKETLAPPHGVPFLLDKGYDSIQGCALGSLIEGCRIKEKRGDLYRLLIELKDRLCVELKLTVLNYLVKPEYYDRNLFETLFKVYLNDPLPDILFICQGIINQYLCINPSLVLPYIQSVIGFAKLHPLLGNLLFLGWGYGSEVCENMLESVLGESTEAVEKCIRTAAENFDDPRFREKALYIFDRYSYDRRKSVREVIIHTFYTFKPEHFSALVPFMDKLLSDLSGENVHVIIDYLQECSADYPEKCYEYLNLIVKKNGRNNFYENRGVLELILGIYQSLKRVDKSNPLLEEILDTFDFVLKNRQVSYFLQEVLKEIDRG